MIGVINDISFQIEEYLVDVLEFVELFLDLFVLEQLFGVLIFARQAGREALLDSIFYTYKNSNIQFLECINLDHLNYDGMAGYEQTKK